MGPVRAESNEAVIEVARLITEQDGKPDVERSCRGSGREAGGDEHLELFNLALAMFGDELVRFGAADMLRWFRWGGAGVLELVR